METRALRHVIGTTTFKLGLLGLMMAIIAAFFIPPLSQFNTSDPLPPIQSMDVEHGREYEIFTVQVATGLFIRNFSYFSMNENRFVVDMVLWFSFDPEEVTLDTISQFAFENGKILEKSTPDVKIIDNKMFAKFNVIAEIKTNLVFKKFPLEDHRLSIILTNNFVTPSEVTFIVGAADFTVADNIFVSDWKIKNLRTNFGIDQNILNKADPSKTIAYPKASFTIEFVKAGVRQLFIIFIPIFLIFLFSLLAFVLTIENLIGRATLTASSVTGLLGYRFVIENMMPRVGYFNFTDKAYITLLVFAFVSFIFHVVTSRIYDVADKTDRAHVISIIERLSFIQNVGFIVISALVTLVLSFIIVS